MYEYVRTHSPNHPFRDKSKRVQEHRIVLEDYLRKDDPAHPALTEVDGIKYIRMDWDVHHINGIQNDNRVENLQVILHSRHSSLTNKGRSPSEKTREKLATAAKKRTPISEETRGKMSLSQTGRRHSKETIGKMSKNSARYWKGKYQSRDEKGRFC